MKKVEYSLIVRQKLKDLRKDLTEKYGEAVSKRSVKRITDAARGLGEFETKGVSVSAVLCGSFLALILRRRRLMITGMSK